MGPFNTFSIGELIGGNTYPGRGIIVGRTKNGKNAVCAYFIMGRSENSRNRVFETKNGELFTAPYDESKVKDPSLIIYPAIRSYENNLIITNGDQTNTVYDYLKDGGTFKEALETRTFEPDAPNFTPRISALLKFKDGDFKIEMSILKSVDDTGSAASRYFYSYPSIPGVGHLIHTYKSDGNPIPPYDGAPKNVIIPDDIDEFTSDIWSSLDENNRISLYVRYTNVETLEKVEKIINKNNK